MYSDTQKYLKFHGADPVQDFSHVLADHGPGDLVVALRSSLHRMPSHVVEGNHVRQDAHSLVEWTEPGEFERNSNLAFHIYFFCIRKT